MKRLRSRLSGVGVKRKFLNDVVLPSWWDDTIAESEGGFREGAGYICGHLGYSLTSLLDDRQPLVFIRREGVKYKKAKGVTEAELGLATNYALGVARSIANAFSDSPPVAEVPEPKTWRENLINHSDKPWVCLRHILDASWNLGIPVIQLQNLPSQAKKPDALTTMIGGRPVIVVMSGRKSPSWIAFIVAHELGHLHHKHLKADQTLVDNEIRTQVEEAQEIEANNYAAQLLTGHPDLGLNSARRLTAKQLAKQAEDFGNRYRISPGVAALNYGFTTGYWPVASGAVSILENQDNAAQDFSNAMEAHLKPEMFSEDAWEWITNATNPDK